MSNVPKRYLLVLSSLALFACGGGAGASPVTPEVEQSIQSLRSDSATSCGGNFYAAVSVERDGINCYANVVAEDRREIITGPVAIANAIGSACITIEGTPEVCSSIERTSSSTARGAWSGRLVLPHAGKPCALSAMSHIQLLLGGCPATAAVFDTKY
ncbi:MAG: hypothetical protein U1A78_25060 [Polyangia bacterium]